MKLAVFDIDGTLTEIGHYDDLYAEAVTETLAIPGIARSWSEYSYSTDSGIMHEACVHALGRPPTANEIARAKGSYIGKLNEVARGPREVAGAADLLRSLDDSGDWLTALATGNWKIAAEFKLERAGIPALAAFATADDSFERTTIIRTAIVEASRVYGCSDFDRTVFVGDAPWDSRAAASLGLPFVVRVRSDRREVAGSHRVEDWRDRETVLDALEAATVPPQPC